MSVLVVVVIVAILAAIAVATLSDGPKTATPSSPPERDSPPTEVPPPSPIAADDPPQVFEPAFAAPPVPPAPPAPGLEPAVLEPSASIPDDRGWARRLRSAGLLGLAVAFLGAATAALIGGSVLIGYRFLDRALG